MFPLRGSFCRLPSRRSNLTSIAYEFCCRMMLYMFKKSLAPCVLRLACNNLKPSNASGRVSSADIKGLSWGTGVDSAIYEVYSRSRCNRVSTITWSAIPCIGGGGGWVITAWAATTIVAAPCKEEKRVALDPTILEMFRDREYGESEKPRLIRWSNRLNMVDPVLDFESYDPIN